jgi:hypothetical protein
MNADSFAAPKNATRTFARCFPSALVRRAALPALLGTLVFAHSLLACGDYTSLVLFTNARNAISPDPAVSTPAIAALRGAGPRGLNALIHCNQALLDSNSIAGSTESSADKESWGRLKAALDAVSRQKDSYASRLYWFTDLDKAQEAARASGKPILSLRLLGNLDEDLSCANSRFFRTTLYANTEVANYLRQHFILHWKSVRPVPKVTIDFGDGRKIQRTITGNSIHYILEADGTVVDALPGLYGAEPFLAGLRKADEAAVKLAQMSPVEKETALRNYHQTRLAALEADWTRDLIRVGATPVALMANSPQIPVAANANPPAQVAGRITASKMVVEGPMLRGGRGAGFGGPQQASEPDDSLIQRVAALHSDSGSLDSGAKALLRAKGPNAFDAMRLAVGKRQVEDPMLRTFQNLERSIAEDTVRNEYLFHSKIHRWLADGQSVGNVTAFNSRVYAELFLTPESDPFLGLVTPATCSAIDNDGRLQAANR